MTLALAILTCNEPEKNQTKKECGLVFHLDVKLLNTQIITKHTFKY